MDAKNIAVNQININILPQLAYILFLLRLNEQIKKLNIQFVRWQQAPWSERDQGFGGWIATLNSAWGKAPLRRWHLRKIKGNEKASCIAPWENSISGERVFQLKETARAKDLQWKHVKVLEEASAACTGMLEGCRRR